MTNMTFKRSKLGFTLAELLLVIAILVILVGLGVTGFVALRQNITIAKYDDLAREIYVAAQNQLIRMEANGLDQVTLDALKEGVPITAQPSDSGYTPEEWEKAKDFYLYADRGNNRPMTVLLPLGAVADDVRTNGYYVIEYNVQTRTVYGVFYSAEQFDYGVVSPMPDFRTSRSVRKGPMVGYYGGSAVERDPLTHCPTPQLQIINENELRLNILNVPEGLTGISVSISDGTKTENGTVEMVAGNASSQTVLLDSMLSGKHFWNIFPSLIPGKNLTITVTYEKENAISSSATITTNSLFATREHETDGDVVTLAWARHLQNLEHSVSHLDDADIVLARQTEHIQWEKDFDPFVSISNEGKNENLKRFEGSNLEIRDLRGSNGLFAQTKENMELSGIRIVNPVISGAGTAPVGALVGEAAVGTVIHGCGVYADKLKDDKTIDYAAYKDCYVHGGTGYTGGLVGQATNTEVTSSFAALPSIKGVSGASLIGSASNCTIKNSYANCDDLQSGFSYFLTGGGNTMTHCYAVGNVASAHQGGFCGTSDAGVTDCYYAVSHRQFAEKWADNKDLAATQFCYKGNGGNWVTINQETMQNATQPGGWAAAWTNMIAPLSHPYREYLNGRAFPYPAIAELDHYGSWPDSNGTVTLKIDMTLLNNQGAGYAIFAGQVVVKDESGTTLFDSNDHKNPDGSFDGKDTIQVTPGTKVTITITTEDGYEYLYTAIDAAQFYPTADPNDAETVEYTVNKDTEAVITFRQKAFTLTGLPAVNEGGTHISNSGYALDLTSPAKTFVITNARRDEQVETGSKVTIRPTVPATYAACVVWYTPAGKNAEEDRTYLTPGTDGSYSFEMPAGNTDVHVMYTKKEAFFKIEYYLMDTEGHYPTTPTQTADYKCGLGSQINQSMIDALAESSGLPLTIDKEKVRYFEHAVVNAQMGTVTNPVFESKLENGMVKLLHGPHLTDENEMSGDKPYLVKIYIARKEYSVTLTADTHVSGVRFGNTGDFQHTVTRKFRYGATVTAQAEVAPGYHFTYWDPQDTRFMMSADTEYTFQVPQFDLHLKASAATDRYLVTINLLENDESWLYSDPSRQADPIKLTLVNSANHKEYEMQVLTEDTVSYAMQAVVPAISEYGAGYYVRVDYANSHRQTWVYTSGAGNTDEQNERLLLYVRDHAVEETAKFYSVTYYPNKQYYSGTVPKGGSYPMYYHLTVQGNTGLLRNLTDDEKIFSGWKDYYAEGTGSNTIYAGNEILMITRRTDMFAQWLKSLTVVYDGNGADGGELPVDLKAYNNGEWVTVKFGGLIKNGYRFLGWSTDKNAQVATYTPTGNNRFQIGTTNITLYAVWEQEKYEVHFCDQDGNPLNGEEYNFTDRLYGNKINVPSLTVDGKQIIGWSLTRGGEIVCRPGEQYTVTGDATLYACVAVQQVTVTYMSGDGKMTYKTEQFGLGIPGYLNCVPESDPVTAWSTQPNGKGTLYFCDESGRSEKAHAFAEDTTLYAVTGKVYNYNEQLWFNTLYDAVRSPNTQSGHTLIVYRDTEEPYNVWINKSLYIMASGNRTVKWKDGATIDNGDYHPLNDPEKEKGEFVGCMNVSNKGNAVTVEFGRSDISTLSMEGSSLTFDANRQSRVISLGSDYHAKAEFHMYDGITLTNGKRDGNKTGNGNTVSNRTGYGGGVYAGAGSVFYMHGGTVSFCEAVSGGGVYLITGSKMYMGDMVLANAYSATAIYYTKVHDDRLNEDVFINTDGVTQDNFKQFYVTTGEPRICYNTSTHVSDETYGDGGGGLLMLDLNNGELTLFRGSITNNTTSGNGGGVMTDSANDKCFLRIYEVDISHNTAVGIGGGIYQWHGTVYIYNSSIRQNRATKGGGIYLKNGGGVYNIEFYFGDISDNEATEYGGGVYAKNGAEFYLRGGNVCRNKANIGGGVYLEGGSSLLSFEKGTISGNTASSNGGGVYANGIINMSGGTLSNNRAGDSGGGAYCYSTSSVTMTGGTVCNNSAEYLGGGFIVGGQIKLSGGSLYGNVDTDYKDSSYDDENHVTVGPNDIYLTSRDRTIIIPKGGIHLSGEERVAVDRDYDGSVRWSSHSAPFPLASYEDATDFKSTDALYFTYHGTRSTQYSIETGKPNLTVATHEGLTGKATGLYLVEEQAGAGRYSYVIFDLNYPGCTNPTPTTYPVNTKLDLNTLGLNTTRPGYYLAGWARTPDAIEENYTLFYDVVENVWRSNFKDGVWTTESAVPEYTVQNLFSQTLYAMWRPSVVVYDVGEQAEANGIEIQPTSIGPQVTILNPNPTQYTEGGTTYYFKHWVDEKGTVYKPMQQVKLTENLRLTAVWEPRVANTYIITFYFNDGTSDQTGELRREVVVKAHDRYKIDVDIHQANKILLGWATSKDATKPDYATDYEFASVEANLSLYAVWADSVTLTYDVNGGDGNSWVESVAKDSTAQITSTVPTREGYIFLGWADTPDAAKEKYHANDSFGPVQLNTTLYAVWEKDPDATFRKVSFDLKGGTGNSFDPVEIPDGKTFKIPAEVPVKDGLTFRGWEMGTFGTAQPGGEIKVTSNMTFTAVWTYTVSFDLAGGTWNQSETVSVREGGAFTPEVPAKEGFTFLYWQTEAGEMFSAEQTIPVTGNMKLTAVWGYKLTFDLKGGTFNGDTATREALLKPGDKFSFGWSSQVTREGYILKGWSENQNATTATYTSKDEFPVERNMTLYAVWTNQVELVFDLGNAEWVNNSPPQSMTIGTAFMIPNCHYRSGWRWITVKSWQITGSNGLSTSVTAGSRFTIPDDQETITFTPVYQ